MVSTRRGARTSEPGSAELALRKKPVRKPATKAAPAATTKAKTTRSKKTEPEAQPDLEQEHTDDELQQEQEKVTEKKEPTKSARAVKTAPLKKPINTARKTTRVKKDDEPVKTVPVTKAPPKTTKPASSRLVKAKASEEETPKLPAPTPAPAPAQSRATRGTRATQAKEKAPPLSPKKITQVSKAPAKITRGAPAKPTATEPAPAKVAPKGRPALRRRNISDENADVPELQPGKDEPKSAETAKQPSKPSSKPDRPRETAQETIVVDNDTTMSSRPVTPTEVNESHSLVHNETLDTGMDSESEDELQNSPDGSSDELCGPKTPMKRVSPREAVRFTSARKQHSPLRSKTPVRRIMTRGTTPQTQKPYSKPAIPATTVRQDPLTVARAETRAMVFPRLEPLPELKLKEPTFDGEDEDQSGLPEDEGTPIPEAVESEDVPDEDVAEGYDESMSTESICDPVDDVTTTEESLGTSQQDLASEECLQIDLAMDGCESRYQTSDLGETSGQHESHVKQPEDPETTVIVNSEDGQDSEEQRQDESSFHSADTVIITRHDGDTDVDESMLDANMPAATPRPETLVWANVQQEFTIPLNFDCSPIVRNGAFGNAEEAQIGPIVGESVGQSAVESQATVEKPRESIGSTRQSMDISINLSDFLDVRALSESVSEKSSHDTSVVDGSEREEPFVAEDIAVPIEEAAPETPVKTSSAHEIMDNDTQQQDAIAPNTPRYALPTISSTRKSLTSRRSHMPAHDAPRPKTSDGTTRAGIGNPFAGSWLSRMQGTGNATPAQSRPRTSHGVPSAGSLGSHTPISRTPFAKTPGTSVPLSTTTTIPIRTPIARTIFTSARTPGTSVPDTIRGTQERFPGLPSRKTYEELDAVDGTAALEETPVAAHSATQERFPGLPSRTSYEELAETPRAQAPASTTPATAAPVASRLFPGTPSHESPEASKMTPGVHAPVTPQPAVQERFPGLPYKRTYEEHAKTAMPVSRFRTPAKAPTKRPATVQKPVSLRKQALKAATPSRARTPNKTPLKVPVMTPGMEVMTPHPAAPLRGVVALVEVYTSDGGCATPAFTSLLQRLGAKTTKTFSERVTHLIFKEGPPNALRRLRDHNKEVAETSKGREMFCVNSRWITDCDQEGRRVDESDEAYAVDVEEIARSSKRRRTSVEPFSLLNMGGNLIHDRKSSARQSVGRSTPAKVKPSPENPSATPKVGVAEKENDDDAMEYSPATPAYLAAPSSLVQQTAPMNRVRKLDFGRDDKSRRLTFFHGRS